jgi:GxxExxY protein
VAQHELQIVYKGRTLEQTYKPDFVCHDKIIIAAKAVTKLDDAHRAQVFNYLRATGMRLGILVNFSS